MKQYRGETFSWGLSDGVIELELHRPPCNEIGTATLAELERFIPELQASEREASVLILFSSRNAGFCAGADLRELYLSSKNMPAEKSIEGVRDFLKRIHRVLNTIDSTPLTTIAAVHGVTFGGGFELALACDIIIADKMARFCFP